MRTLLILELPAIFEVKLGRIELHGLRDPSFHLVEIRRHVSIGQIDPNREVAVGTLARNRAFAVPLRDFCDLR